MDSASMGSGMKSARNVEDPASDKGGIEVLRQKAREKTSRMSRMGEDCEERRRGESYDG